MEPFAIAYGKNKTAIHWRQTTVTWDEILGWMKSPGSRKDITGYVLGRLRPTSRIHKHGDDPCLEMHRVKDGIESRSALALDVDFPTSEFLERMDLTFSHLAVMHTTYSSAPDDPHYRLLIPTDREMAPDEYISACQAMMQKLGTDHFDQSTDEPERFMYKPSAQQPDWFQHWVYSGNILAVDDLLAGFERDLSQKPIPTKGRTKRNPFEIDGVIGAFNRAYEDWDLLIQQYDLPYEKLDDNRYHLMGSKSEAGMGPIGETVGLVYSHHSNDPAFGKTCSAFDLVRLHLFGDQDEQAKVGTPVNKLPSHLAMMELATTDHRVTAELVGVDFNTAMDDNVVSTDGWKINLHTASRSGFVRDNIHNWDLIVQHDPVFQNLYFNELSLSPEFRSNVPWRKVGSKVVSNTDRWEIVHYLEREFNGFSPTRMKVDAMVDTKAGRRPVNPVRDYLKNLVWDGVPRVEECLPGVRPTEHTRRIARKVMTAAVARMMEPGCKWDHTLVLYGPEGIGKSHWIDTLARGYSSSLGRIDNKDTLLIMQRSWILVADEAHSLRKTDQDAQKEFLTRTADVFRMPYDRETLVHPRHCVIWSTTNDSTFLRRQEGNRRFLIVYCQDKVDFKKITPQYVDQLWAEAVHLYNSGELLYLDDLEAEIAVQEREQFVEEDAMLGFIEEYVNLLVPEDWWDMSVDARVQWMVARAEGFEPPGTMLMDRVCSAQIWVEALNRRKGDAHRSDLLDINNVLKRMPDWEPVNGRYRIPGYGPQQIFIRKDLL
jgi:predicted P-loop ATPase